MKIRQSLLRGADGASTVAIAGLVIGTTLAFGGAVWWARPLIAALAFLVVLACLVRMLLEGSMRVLKSPLTPLGGLVLALGALQLAPLPGPIATVISPRSHAAYSQGVLPELVRADDPGAGLPEPAAVRSPVTLDRSATLRWVAGAMACLALFWGVSQSVDRLGRLYLVWGCIVAAFFVNTAFAVVQVGCRVGGLYGKFEPGRGPFWSPSMDDLTTTPNAVVLRTMPAPEGPPTHPAWASLVPDRPFLFGSLMGGPGAYLALGSLGLPMALALMLQLMAPRGSREGFRARMGHSGQGSLVVLLGGLILASALLVGLLAGPWLSLPFAVGLMLAGLPGAWATGLRWTSVAVTALALSGLAAGVVIGDLWARVPDAPIPFVPDTIQETARVWSDALAIVADFPILGTGVGSFAAVEPFYKSTDAASTSALSSLLQWYAESGLVGLSLLLIGVAWCLFRIPGALRRVGTADRSLVFGLIGTAASFSLYSALHWTVELAAVAVAASAWGGTWNRWLAGGTDLFVERG